MWMGYGMAWLSTAMAVMYAIQQTGEMAPLWFMIIPLFVSISSSSGKDGDKNAGN